MLSTAPVDCQDSDNTCQIHVLEPGKGIWDVIRQVAHSGIQEDPFYILDVNDIIRKHQDWTLKMPRVTPFYGKLFDVVRFSNSEILSIL